MAQVRIAHTANLTAAELVSARALLYEVFDDMTEDDWEHALGGMHALALEGTEVIGHASVIMRRLIHGGRALRAGYLEGVAVRSDRRGHGHGGAMMDALERLIRNAYDLGALGATDEAAQFYAHRGWQSWKGPTYALTPSGIVRTEAEEGYIFVLPVTGGLDRGGGLTCDWRGGDCW